MKRAKFNYYKSKIDVAEGDPRKFWSVVNEVAGRRTKHEEQFPIKAFNAGSRVTPLKASEISNSFNQYFASVGEQLVGAIHQSGPSEVSDLDHVIDAGFELRLVLDMTNYISDQYSKRKQVLITFLDLAKAFDSIDRNKLLIKLQAIGFRKRTLDWFKSYFENRYRGVQWAEVFENASLD